MSVCAGAEINRGESTYFTREPIGEHIERWLRQKKTSPLTNKSMGTRLTDHGDGRYIVSSAIENGLVDADAAAAWHLASARLKIVGELPGGLDSAKEHLAAVAPSPESERAEEAPEREASVAMGLSSRSSGGGGISAASWSKGSSSK